MHIESVTIANYKSFLEKQTIHLEPGFNLLLGTNNAGKTSVLDVIDMDLNLNEPHRSAENVPEYGFQAIGHSTAEISIATTYTELRRLIHPTELYYNDS